VEVIPIEGDGNCVARSLATIMWNDANKWMDVRQIIANEFKAHRAFYSAMETNPMTLAHHVMVQGSWLGFDELFAFSNASNVALALHPQTSTNAPVRTHVNGYTFLPLRHRACAVDSMYWGHLCWGDYREASHMNVLLHITHMPVHVFRQHLIPKHAQWWNTVMSTWTTHPRVYTPFVVQSTTEYDSELLNAGFTLAELEAAHTLEKLQLRKSTTPYE
jgi:hypothetical protein